VVRRARARSSAVAAAVGTTSGALVTALHGPGAGTAAALSAAIAVLVTHRVRPAEVGPGGPGGSGEPATQRLDTHAATGDRVLSSILDQVHDAIVIFQRDGRIRLSNLAFTALVGDDVLRGGLEHPLHLIHPDDHEAMHHLRRRLLDDPGATATARCRLRRSDRSWTNVDLIGTNRLADPDIGGFVVSVRDIGEMLDAMEQMAHSERRARFLADNAGEVLLQADASGRIRYATPSSSAVLDADPDALVGTQLVDLVHHDDQPAVRRALSDAVQRRAARQLEVRARDASLGGVRWLAATVRSVIGPAGSTGVVEFHVGLRDITAGRASAEALATSERRLRTLVETAPIGIFETDLSGRFTLANAAHRQILGATGPTSSSARRGSISPTRGTRSRCARRGARRSATWHRSTSASAGARPAARASGSTCTRCR
jgi:PAS domain S-box-containing protein